MRGHPILRAAVVVSLMALPPTAAGQGSVAADPLSLQDVMSVKIVAAPAIAPDGTSVLYTVQQWEDAGPRGGATARKELRTRVWRAPADSGVASGDARLVTPSGVDASAPAWSPDGRFISFMASGPVSAGSGAPRPQVWIMPRSDGEATLLTDAPEGISSYVWSPDGRRLAFTARETPPKALDDRRRRGDDATVFEEEFRNLHLWTFDLESKKTIRLTPAEGLTVKGPPSWAPDGSRLAFVAAPTPMPRDHRDAVYLVKADGGALEKITTSQVPHRAVAWSPDGATIAFACQVSTATPLGDRIPPQPVGLFHLTLFDVASRRLRDVHGQAFDRNAGAPTWTPDSRRILFSTEDGVYQEVFAFEVATGRYTRLTSKKNITFGSISRNGSRVAFTMESPVAPDEVYVADPGLATMRQLTAANASLADRAIGETEVVSWKSTDDQVIDGLLIKPVGFAASRRYPLLVVPHGGPASAHLAGFFGTWRTDPGQYWAGQGWAVFYPNPRGSRSSGERFVQAVVGDWGGGDYRDIVAGVDALIARGIADPERLAVKGWSYGGYMTCWIVSQTTRFKAAVMGAAITDVVSFHGTTAIPGRTATYFGGVPSAATLPLYLQRSGLTHADRVMTPLLILHGAADQTVSPGQSYEFFRALADRGKTVRLVTYPREGHMLTEYYHVLDMYQREFEWISRYTVGQ